MKCSKVFFLSILCITNSAYAELYFDPNLVSSTGGEIADLAYFKNAESQLPGVYYVTIYLNGNPVTSKEINFISVKDLLSDGQTLSTLGIHDNTGLLACLNPDMLSGLGIELSDLIEQKNKEQCISLGQHIPQAWMAFNFQKMRLDISIPQASMQNRPRGWVSPALWDEGINAALMSWQFSGSENHGQYGNSRSQYLNLTSGLNFGSWRLRDNSTWRNNESSYSHSQRWQHLNTYLQRAIIPWRSELTLGDGTSDGDVFDSLSFRGIHIATDDNMYPDSMRGFAPVVRGTANSNAQISIRQNGNVIYRKSVAAGDFVIRDLYSLSRGGDLDVSITETDGSVRVFTVPYSSVPVLQREGRARYGLTIGRFRQSSNRYDDPAFAQATLLWGGPHNITLYGGTQFAEKYRAVALGSGINMGTWGAISADITHADSILSDDSHSKGQSVRFLYGRSLITTGTTFQLAGYRYSTSGFHTLDETALKRMSGWFKDTDEQVDLSGRPIEINYEDYYNLYRNKRAQLQANISQSMGTMGSLYLTANRQSYWHSKSTTSSLQAGFSSTVGKVSYSLSYSYSRFSEQPHADKTFWLSLSIPLDGWSTARSDPVWATYNAGRDADGNVTHQVGLSGSALDAHNLSWSVSQGYSQQDKLSGDIGLGYMGTYGTLSGGYGYSQNYRQLRYGSSGSAVLHSEGITFGQPLGTSNVLVAAPGASGVLVESGTGIRTDWRGYAIVPYAGMYRDNRVALDLRSLDEHTEIDNTVSRVVPTRGAIVQTGFRTQKGVRALMTLQFNGKALPFGSQVKASNGNSYGIVGDGGEVYLSGLDIQGVLTVQWGDKANQHCTVNYTLPEKDLKTPLIQFFGTCR